MLYGTRGILSVALLRHCVDRRLWTKWQQALRSPTNGQRETHARVSTQTVPRCLTSNDDGHGFRNIRMHDGTFYLCPLRTRTVRCERGPGPGLPSGLTTFQPGEQRDEVRSCKVRYRHRRGAENGPQLNKKKEEEKACCH